MVHKITTGIFKLLNLLTNGNTEMQINAKSSITNLNKQNLYYMERSTYGHMQTTHTLCLQCHHSKLFRKKLMKSQYLVLVYITVQGCWEVLSPTRRERSYSDRRFWCSYIPFIIIIGGILVLFVYITRLTSNEISLLSNKIHREVSRAKDLSAPW